MVAEVGADVMVLFPSKLSVSSTWNKFVNNDHDCYVGDVTFSKVDYYVFHGKVFTNPKFSEISCEISPVDLKHGFEEGNFGCDVLFESENDADNTVCLVTWSNVLYGRKSGIQV